MTITTTEADAMSANNPYRTVYREVPLFIDDMRNRQSGIGWWFPTPQRFPADDECDKRHYNARYPVVVRLPPWRRRIGNPMVFRTEPSQYRDIEFLLRRSKPTDPA